MALPIGSAVFLRLADLLFPDQGRLEQVICIDALLVYQTEPLSFIFRTLLMSST